MVVDLLHNEFSKELWMSREEGGRRLFIYQAGVFGAFAGVALTYLYRVLYSESGNESGSSAYTAK
jgi:hypothetical protein